MLRERRDMFWARVTVHSCTDQARAGGAATEAQYSVAAPSSPLANVPIQYGLIIKILDMFFDCKHDRWLQNIHSQAISKILDTKSLVS